MHQIPRYLGIKSSNHHVTYSLVCFCDALANKAYTATVYLHQVSSCGCKADLIFSKTHLAPHKSVTIPRLKLLGVMNGTQALRFVQKELTNVIKGVVDRLTMHNPLASEQKTPPNF